MQFQQTALSVRGLRQQLLASNIANADTPNYKARDIDFNEVLKSKLQVNAHQSATALAKTSDQHLDSTRTLDGITPQFRNMVQGNVDGNTVDMDVERNAFADNAVRYEAGLTMINMQIRNMLAAIQG
ncbi:flagellar basal body rod protein FlgB [Undibacterium jejuense]|uniref:Flagellar basal body rod protein FlgB n=1 Tax=Undibacterium jejuense TaxID=1344949 RepID=A0A923HAB1_9BURK|nr:flagellar basal body rod protein FlgB [Undibacterium jejuense]MBC3860677.1 flagellar basal body rod protein FlgB [Undibacterium jejuense]